MFRRDRERSCFVDALEVGVDEHREATLGLDEARVGQPLLDRREQAHRADLVERACSLEEIVELVPREVLLEHGLREAPCLEIGLVLAVKRLFHAVRRHDEPTDAQSGTERLRERPDVEDAIARVGEERSVESTIEAKLGVGLVDEQHVLRSEERATALGCEVDPARVARTGHEVMEGDVTVRCFSRCGAARAEDVERTGVRLSIGDDGPIGDADELRRERERLLRAVRDDDLFLRYLGAAGAEPFCNEAAETFASLGPPVLQRSARIASDDGHERLRELLPREELVGGQTSGEPEDAFSPSRDPLDAIDPVIHVSEAPAFVRGVEMVRSCARTRYR